MSEIQRGNGGQPRVSDKLQLSAGTSATTSSGSAAQVQSEQNQRTLSGHKSVDMKFLLVQMMKSLNLTLNNNQSEVYRRLSGEVIW